MLDEKSDRKAQRTFRGLRLGFLVLFLAAATLMGISHQYFTGGRAVSVDALCPFGALESAITLAESGAMIERIAWSSFILLAATLVAALVLRRVFCGSVCAFGTLQELFGKLGRKVLGKRFTVPAAVDKPARFLKYAALAAIVGASAATGTLAIRPYDPWAAYNHLLSAELIQGFSAGLIVLAASLAGSFFYDRFFCKYLCPMGGFLGLIHGIGIFRVRRVEATCTHCHACDKACPVNIPVESMERVSSAECINCNLCVSACPVKNTLVIAGPREGRVSELASLFIALAIFAGIVGAGTAIGSFQWTVKPLERVVEEKKAFDPADIKGTDTFKSVAGLTGIPEKEFLVRFEISEEAFGKPIRESAHAPGSGFDTQDVREFVRLKLGR
jgi:polyferredoxin